MRTRSPLTIFALAGMLLAALALGGCAMLQGHDTSAAGITPVEHRQAERYFLEGSILQMQEHYADAIAQYENVLRIAPQHAAVRYAMARCYRALGRNDTALTYAESALAIIPDNVDARMELADLLLANGRLARAVEQYEEVVRREPGNIQARYNAARLLRRIDPARSIKHYEYIRKYLGEDYNALLNLAELYMTQKNYDGVVDVMRELLVLDGSNADLYRVLSDAYQRAGRYADATKLLAEVAQQIAPDSVLQDFLVEEASRTAQNMTKDTLPGIRAYARTVAAMVTAHCSTRWESSFYSGMIFYHLNDSLTADSLIQRALANKSTPAVAWTEAAGLYIDDGHSARALRFLAPTAGRFKEDYHVPYLLGYAYYTLNRQDSAERYVKKSLAIEDQNGDAWAQLARIYSRQGKTAACEDAYERAVEFDSDNQTLLNDYAYFLAGRGRRLEYALSLIDNALEKEPENESFLDTKGWIYFKLANYKQALQYIQRSVDIGGASAEVLEHLGDTERALGDAAAAHNTYGRALKFNAESKDLRRKYDDTASSTSR